MSDMRTFRPTGVRIISYGVFVLLVIVTIVIANAMPEEMAFRPAETGTLWALLLTVLVLAHIVARSYVRADDQGLKIVNGVKTHHVTWDEVVLISMKPGAPWPTLVTHDEREIILFGIQGSEGKSATDAVTWLRGHLERA